MTIITRKDGLIIEHRRPVEPRALTVHPVRIPGTLKAKFS